LRKQGKHFAPGSAKMRQALAAFGRIKQQLGEIWGIPRAIWQRLAN
jgi:hypothetical protein